MGEEEMALIALAETTRQYAGAKKKGKKSQKKKKATATTCEESAQNHDEERNDDLVEKILKQQEQNDGDNQRKSMKLRLSKIKLRFLKPDFSRLLGSIHRPDFSRFRGGLGGVNCFHVEEDEMPVVDIERHRSVDLGLRRTSLYFFRRRPSICQHPFHPYTPKQETRLVWNVQHFKS